MLVRLLNKYLNVLFPEQDWGESPEAIAIGNDGDLLFLLMRMVELGKDSFDLRSAVEHGLSFYGYTSSRAGDFLRIDDLDGQETLIQPKYAGDTFRYVLATLFTHDLARVETGRREYLDFQYEDGSFAMVTLDTIELWNKDGDDYDLLWADGDTLL